MDIKKILKKISEVGVPGDVKYVKCRNSVEYFLGKTRMVVQEDGKTKKVKVPSITLMKDECSTVEDNRWVMTCDVDEDDDLELLKEVVVGFSLLKCMILKVCGNGCVITGNENSVCECILNKLND